MSCISFDSYIKPQLVLTRLVRLISCISFDSYIKPQLASEYGPCTFRCISFDSYIKPQLVAYVPGAKLRCISFDSYIKPQPVSKRETWCWGCISFDSYIKPQPICVIIACDNVVYLLIPTSNHNHISAPSERISLYIFWFLHQTTTIGINYWKSECCISFDSYIKPQLARLPQVLQTVVYLLIPTSNHNLQLGWIGKRYVVYLLIPTSNHNANALLLGEQRVVYLLIPTSNHNGIGLYILG